LGYQISALLTELGLRYKIIDDEAFAPCPFHSPDHHPSWSVNLRSGVYYCFSCGAKGNLGHLVSHLTGRSYTASVVYVNQKIGWAKAGKWREDYGKVSVSPMSVKISETDMALFTDPPQEALDQKKITLCSSRKYEVRWNSAHQSWIFPLRDPYSTELWGWQEKSERIFRNYPAGTRKSRTIFGLSNASDESTVTLLESPVDAVVLDAAGITGGVSAFGIPTGGYQLSLILERTEHLRLSLDSDNPGADACARVIKDWIGKFNRISVFNYGNSTAKDIGEMDYEQIRWGVDNELPALTWLTEYEKKKKERGYGKRT
jgi:hypothetical protein